MVEAEARQEAGLREYARMLRRQAKVVLATALVAALVALVAASRQARVYQSSAQLLVQPSVAQSILSPFSATVTATEIQTDIQLLSGAQIHQAVARALGSAPPVTATEVGTSNVIAVTAQSATPQGAAAVANAYASAYVKVTQARAVHDLLSGAQQIRSQVDSLQSRIDKQGPGPQRDALVQQQSTLNQQLQQLQVNASLASGSADVVAPAAVNSKPVAPNKIRDGLLGLGIGLVLGIGFALLREYLNDAITSKADLEQAVEGVTAIGLVPKVQTWSDPGDAIVVSLTEPESPAAEAYRSLRTSIQFISEERGGCRTIQVTSPKAGEGKTTTVANLAVALAKAGQRVAIVGCDLRRPRLHSFFGIDSAVGFTSVVLGEVPLDQAVQRAPFDDHIVLLPAGPVPTNPSELLSTRRAKDVFSSFASVADIVLIDSPPVLPVTDAAVISTQVDGTLLVVTAGSSRRRDLVHAVEALRQVRAPLLGTILNGATRAGAYDAYRYDYGYGYGPYATTAGAKRQRWAWLPGANGPALSFVRRRGPLVAASMLIAAAAGWLITPQPSRYAATATVSLARSVGPEGAASPASVARLATSAPVLAGALSHTGTNRSVADLAGELTVTDPPRTTSVSITVSDGNPRVAEDLADSVAAAVVSNAQSLAPPGTQGPLLPALSVTHRASLPTAPLSDHVGRNVAIALAAGLAASLAFALLLDTRRRTIRTVLDVERRLGLPVIGAISPQRQSA